MKSLKIASALVLFSSLVACGGGGGGGDGGSGDSGTVPPATPGSGTVSATTLVSSSVKGLDVALTYSGSTVTAVNPSAVALAPTFSNVTSLDAFTLNDSYGDPTSQFAFNMAGIAAGDFVNTSTNSGATDYSIGGTTWTYARFGIFKNAVGTSAQYTIRNTPFFLANVSSGATLTDATYATSGRAVGVMSTSTTKTGVKCNVSAAYTQSTQEVVLTLSNCVKDGSTPAVSVSVSGTIRLTPTGGAFSGFNINDGVALTPSTVYSSGYKFGGPTGQELVGAATVSGANGYFTFAFGAKK